MNRIVGVTFRRTVGGVVVLLLGFAAASVAPRVLVPVAASTSTTPPLVAIGGPVNDDTLSHIRSIALKSPPPSPPSSPIVASRHAVALAPIPTAAMVVVPKSGSPNPSGFAYGYCTWWVAHKRYVPWRGNAAQWWWNARPYGYAEGSVPRVGSIMVMAAGGSASPEGHVAYVEKVNPNGTFMVSEMNWWGVPGGGWGRVDYRTVTSMSGILGFIY